MNIKPTEQDAHVRVPADLHRRLKVLAAEQQLSLRSILVKLIERYLKGGKP